MGDQSRRTGAYTNQMSAEKYVGEITSLFEPFLVTDILDKEWFVLQDSLYRLIRLIMRGEKSSEKACSQTENMTGFNNGEEK